MRPDPILFIAAGAFHGCQPSDLMPELQGRLPIRVSLDDLTRDDFVRILSEPENALTKQHVALLGTEGVRIMTVHQAKGLEFPVVILCDPGAPIQHATPSRYQDTKRRVWVETVAHCTPSELRDHWEEGLRRARDEHEVYFRSRLSQGLIKRVATDEAIVDPEDQHPLNIARMTKRTQVDRLESHR